MWYAGETSIGYSGEGNSFELPLFIPRWEKCPREVFSIPCISEKYEGSDDWTQRYPPDKEVSFVISLIDSLVDNPRPIHINGLTCAGSWDLIAEYYISQGYENIDTHNFTLPLDALLTVSVSLQHLLWCEKDKIFLSKKEKGVPHYAIVPPLRTPADLRILQQAARRDMILGISVSHSYESYLGELFEKQILTPFQLSQLLSFRWKQYGFTGTEKNISMNFPDFYPHN